MVTSRQLTIDEEYIATHPGAKKLYEEAKQQFPSGVTHDARYFQPFPIYITHAQGSKKWDVDGHEYIDYWAGHGTLVLGHNHPALVEAGIEQLKKGTHYGGCHELELKWGELVSKMVPCAERVKFFSSGTEATMMAMRLARAYTGRTKILKFQAHFHGWHDYATVAMRAPWDVPTSAGVPKETASTMIAVPPSDIEAVRAALAGGEVAAVIIEPAGAGTFNVPLRPGFLAELREATKESGAVLIFDEVVTGFRLAPGGAQEYYGVTPDMSTHAKALTGAVPGAALGGKKEILALLEFSGDAQRDRFSRIAHPGTFNANPLAAAIAVANLTILSQGRDTIYAPMNKMGAKLRAGMNEAIKRHGLPGCVYGDASTFKVAIDKKFADLTPERAMSGTYDQGKLLSGMGASGGRLRRSMILSGVDLSRTNGLLTAAHSEEDIEKTIAAFDGAIERMKAEGTFN